MKKNFLFIYNLIFTLIILTIISYHYHSHYLQIKNNIINLITKQATLIAKRIEISATNASYSEKFIKNILSENLKSHAKFITLMNSIENFTSNELTDYIEETNIDFIAILNSNNNLVVSNNTFPNNILIDYLKNKPIRKMFFYEKNKYFFYVYTDKNTSTKVLTAINAKDFIEIMRKISVKALLERLKLERKNILLIDIKNGKVKKSITLLKNRVFEIKIPFKYDKDKYLKLQINARHALRIIDNFRHNVIIFILMLTLIGIIGTFLLYKLQDYYLKQIKKYEKKIFEQEKDASVGRSAALIAHEIRNPVNAVSMGLQRIKYETDVDANLEYSMLIRTMQDELNKINEIIENFLDYSKPLKLEKTKLDLEQVLNDILQLYKSQKISFENLIDKKVEIFADKTVLTQAFMNIIKNATENQETTYLKIYMRDNNLIFENNGANEQIDTKKIFEPYFTTKTKGTGLGLAFVKKIVEVHGWEIFCKINMDIIKIIIKF